MQVVKTVDQVRELVRSWRKEGLSIGLVPTMGYLHEGHASLVRAALAGCDRVVVSVFVNPTQFGPNEDLQSYPRDFAHDEALLEGLGAHALFYPAVDEMYRPGASTWVTVEGLTEGLCGRTRPTHFRGVCTVVSKLLHIVMPERAYFGQKDAQQLAVIRRMVLDLNMPVEIIGCPIVREADGLAKSSRNTYLTREQRQAALCLSRAVRAGSDLAERGVTSTKEIIEAMRSVIEREPLARIDYIEAVDNATMQPVEVIAGEVLFAEAVYIGKTRLIDNFIARPKA